MKSFLKREEIIHIETVTMMAKYQIIFIKLEDFIKKVIRIFEDR